VPSPLNLQQFARTNPSAGDSSSPQIQAGLHCQQSMARKKHLISPLKLRRLALDTEGQLRLRSKKPPDMKRHKRMLQRRVRLCSQLKAEPCANLTKRGPSCQGKQASPSGGLRIRGLALGPYRYWLCGRCGHRRDPFIFLIAQSVEICIAPSRLYLTCSSISSRASCSSFHHFRHFF
jgi:hypothetical protein